MVAVHTNNENGRFLDQFRLHVFRTADGQELKCRNCQGEYWSTLDKVAWPYWRANKHYFITTRGTGSAGATETFWLASIEGDSYSIRKVKEIPLRIDAMRVGISANLSEDGAKLAWIVCNGLCELFELDLKSNEEIRSLVSCPKVKRMTVAWKNNQASRECH